MLKIKKVINIGNNPKAMAKTYQKQKTYKCCIFFITLLLFNNNNNIKQW